jgi:hypothetical protein
MTETATLVTPEMEQHKGVWVGEKTAYPVSESDIRKWAIAVYWPAPPPRLFWDADYAATTRWGGIVAPEDFNPFAWPVPTGGAGDPMGGLPGLRGGNILNGGQVDTFGVRMRPGDVITSHLRLSHWEERQGKAGMMLFSYYESEWHNQDRELVKTRMSTLIQF